MSDQNTGGHSPNKNPLFSYKDTDVSAKSNQALNNPLAHQAKLDPKDKEFLTMLMEKVDKGEINLYRPGTLLNHPIYDKLNEKAMGKADFNAVTILTTIREIRQLWVAGHSDTYQIENLAHRLRIIKERLEEVGGDIYII